MTKRIDRHWLTVTALMEAFRIKFATLCRHVCLFSCHHRWRNTQGRDRQKTIILRFISLSRFWCGDFRQILVDNKLRLSSTFVPIPIGFRDGSALGR